MIQLTQNGSKSAKLGPPLLQKSDDNTFTNLVKTVIRAVKSTEDKGIAAEFVHNCECGLPFAQLSYLLAGYICKVRCKQNETAAVKELI